MTLTHLRFAAAVLAIVGLSVGVAWAVAPSTASAQDENATENTSHNLTLVVRDTEDRFHEEVHAVAVDGTTVVTVESVGGEYGYNVTGANESKTELWLRVGAMGGDVHASFTPDGCSSDSCRVEMTTTNGGERQETWIRDRPAHQWKWRVEAVDTTVHPIDVTVVWDWVTYEKR